MARFIFVTLLVLALGMGSNILAQEEDAPETPEYSEGDVLLLKTLQKTFIAANEACQAVPEVQDYQALNARVRTYIEKTYEGYTLGSRFELVPIVEVTSPPETEDPQ